MFLLASVSGRSLPRDLRRGDEMRLNSRLLQDYFNATAMGDTASSTSESFFNRVGIYIVGFGCAIVLIVAISVVAVL
jgi:hypothetical protein